SRSVPGKAVHGVCDSPRSANRSLLLRRLARSLPSRLDWKSSSRFSRGIGVRGSTRMSETSEDLTQYVEAGDGIQVIHGSGDCRGWNGIRYKVGMSAKNVGSTKLSMNVATIPPGGVAKAHIHVGFELMLYILQGKVRHEYGPGLKKVVENQAGDFIY